MADIYHDPLPSGDEAKAFNFNHPLYQLDDAIQSLKDGLAAAAVGVVLVPYTFVPVEANWLHIPLPDPISPHLEITTWVSGLTQNAAVSFNEKCVVGVPDDNYTTTGLVMYQNTGIPGKIYDDLGLIPSYYTYGSSSPILTSPTCLVITIWDYSSETATKRVRVDVTVSTFLPPPNGTVLAFVASRSSCHYRNPNPITSVQVHDAIGPDFNGNWLATMVPPTAYIIRGFW